MTSQVLVTTKLTRRALVIIRRLAAQTGEKQYRLIERVMSAEDERVNGKKEKK